jgi:hypothetical protein
VLRGRRVALRALQSVDYQALYTAETDPRLGASWRFGGSTPAPEAYASALWQGVFTQFAAVEPLNFQLIGIVTAYNADFQNGSVWLAMLSLPGTPRPSPVLDAMGLFINHLFDTLPLENMFAECRASRLSDFEGGSGQVFNVCGRLEGFYRSGFEREDKVFLQLTRKMWESVGPRLIAAISVESR